MTQATCEATTTRGSPCRMRPLVGEAYCTSHHPEHRDAAQAARRLGGLRRRREREVARTYDIPDLISADMSAIRRIAEIAILEALELGNSVPRVKALLSGCALLVRVREVSDMEERMIALETALGRDKKGRAS